MARRISPSIVEPTLEELLPTPEAMHLFQQFTAALEAGRLVRRWREAAGLTQKQLAERLRLTQARISAIERGRGRDGPTYGLMQRLATACGIGWPTGIAVAAKADALFGSFAGATAEELLLARGFVRLNMSKPAPNAPLTPATRTTARGDRQPAATRRVQGRAREE
jgi:transcriptional regulator with XRE-family HTH domain